MKQIAFCIIALLLTVGMAAEPAPSTQSANSRQQILTRGTLGGGGTVKSLPTADPVEIYQTPASIEVEINRSVGDIVITVTGRWGITIYREKVKAVAGNCVVIPTINWNAGVYTIRITDTVGGYLEGQFVK